MSESYKLLSLCCTALIALSSTALADGYEYEGEVIEPPKPQREFTYSFNIAGTSNYIFRGISQTDNDPTLQGGGDLAYGSLYLGVWASGVDFGDTGPPNFQDIAWGEVDIYAGYKPSWDTKTFLGKIDFDFGVIYYAYPNARDAGAELDYVELKAGYSWPLWSFLIPNMTSGTAVFYSPDYTGETGSVWTVESTYTWEGNEIRGIKPIMSGLVGWQKGNSSEGFAVNQNGTDDEYYYWNAGLELVVDKLSLDFRYWDSNIGEDAGGLCVAANLCDEKFVFTVKVEVP